MSILGIDEVGRGPLAGPLVVGAVILPDEEQPWFSELKDSKKLTATKREALSTQILATSAAGLGWVLAEEIDQIGMSKALELATKRAVKRIQPLHTSISQIVIDGKVNFLAHTPLAPYVSTCIKADAKFPAVSAASIIAKVARDNYMKEIADQYPGYFFERHVGYGTKLHLQAIYAYGLTPEHRLSFEPCKSFANFTPTRPAKKNTTNQGHRAESAVADYLSQHGHTIIAQNHKTYFYEIDLVSIKGNRIYFTEVKYRQNTTRGTGLDAITKDKLQQMRFAATSFLKYTHTKFKNHDPILAVADVTGPAYQVKTWLPLSE